MGGLGKNSPSLICDCASVRFFAVNLQYLFSLTTRYRGEGLDLCSSGCFSARPRDVSKLCEVCSLISSKGARSNYLRVMFEFAIGSKAFTSVSPRETRLFAEGVIAALGGYMLTAAAFEGGNGCSAILTCAHPGVVSDLIET